MTVNIPTFPTNSISCVANLWSKQMHFKKAGDFEQGHTHQFDHLTLLAAGSLRVTVEGVSTEFKAPHMIYIKAGKSHFIEALEDGTVAYCVHAVRDKETEDILDPNQIPLGINAFEAGLAKPV